MLTAKLDNLKGIFQKMEKVLVAFSGGVDSAFVLKVAHSVLNKNVLALTAVSPSLAAAEKEETICLAQSMGVRHLLVDSHEMENPNYLANPTNRCYFCKSELYKICQTQADKLGISHIVDGFNVDDQSDYRPGFQAKQEYQIRSPLLEVGLTKVEIRTLSRELGLPTWDKPASPCLASRIPYGIPVKPETLGKIERLEAFLKTNGFKNFRVRYHEKSVRLELSPEDISKIYQNELRLLWIALCKKEGFEFVTLDLEEFRSGRLNEMNDKNLRDQFVKVG